MVELKENLKVLGFIVQDGTDNIYIKKYGTYTITINYNEKDPNKSKIDYGSIIEKQRHRKIHFEQSETLVVLESVDRLLRKGYKPENIELEKPWKLGHKPGYLDIWVKDENGDSFLMIECKTWGREYNEAKRKTQIYNSKKEFDGGQIFSYLQQEPRTTKAICYYTSTIDSKNVKYENAIIHNKKEWSELNQIERFNMWSKAYENNGIFEKDIPLYTIKSHALLRKDLRVLTEEDSRNLYKQFAEILRHNVVSDKPNAFNKIINLFLCKIYDEEKPIDSTEELKFQTRTNGRDKTDEELLEDLNDLYKVGMKQYLEKDVSDYSKKEFEDLLNSVDSERKKDDFKYLYKTLRLYKNNEFAFKEVFDEKSFKDNAKVVREVVELLQDYQLRYTKKQQFLGDFYETLLNDSIKQEAGQFFTPVPITQFIIKSLPIKEIILNKIKNGDLNILPYVMDYACGTGHFLTEIMEEINTIIKDDLSEEKFLMSVDKKLKSWKDYEFSWADEFIYGMDLDYRLIKASKISCFLNGDGKANLIHANGLAPFNNADYIKKLKTETIVQENPQFDILIANPPYSVDEFGKHALTNGSECFELFSELTEKSSAIECFFVERAKQLVKEGGYVGIVLPVSLLTNDKIYTKTREILLKYFDIKGILSLHENAFMATNTKTVVLFMQRRNNSYWENINKYVKEFFVNYKDVAVVGIEKIFSKYVQLSYEDLYFDDYISILKNYPSELAKKSDLYKYYEINGIENTKTQEYRKILYFILSFNSKVIVADSGEKAEEKTFLGYEFKTIDHQKKINIYRDDDDNIISALFSDTDMFDDNKLNYLMYMNILNQNIDNEIRNIIVQEDNNLKKHVDYCRLSELIDFSLDKFEIAINLNARKKLQIESVYPQEKFENIVSYFSSGVTYENKDVSQVPTKNIILTADNITLGNKLEIKKQIYLKDDFKIQEDKKLKKEDIFICLSSGSKRHVGKTVYIDSDLDSYAGGFMGIIRTNKEKMDSLFLSSILQCPTIKQTLEALSTGNNINNLYNAINSAKIPVPPPSIQKKVINEAEEYNKKYNDNLDRIKELNKKIESISTVVAKEDKIVNYIKIPIQRGKSPKYAYKSDIQIIKSGQIRGLKSFDFSKKYYASPSMEIDDRLLQKGDLLINSTGVGTAGRVNIFDLDEKCFVDSHVAILRLDQTRLLPVYLLYQLYFNIGFKNIEKMATGQSGQIELAPDTIANIKIPVPSIEEQKRIVAEILPLEKEIEKLQKEIDEIPLKKQAILDKYLK